MASRAHRGRLRLVEARPADRSAALGAADEDEPSAHAGATPLPIDAHEPVASTVPPPASATWETRSRWGASAGAVATPTPDTVAPDAAIPRPLRVREQLAALPDAQ